MFPETVAFVYRDQLEIKVSVIGQRITYSSYPLTPQEKKKVLMHFRNFKINDYESKQVKAYFILQWINQGLTHYYELRRKYLHFYGNKLVKEGLSKIINNLIRDKKVIFDFDTDTLKITTTGKEFLENRELL